MEKHSKKRHSPDMTLENLIKKSYYDEYGEFSLENIVGQRTSDRC